MMMALKQCAQAAQSLASAAQNKDGAEALQDPSPTATQAPLASQPPAPDSSESGPSFEPDKPADQPVAEAAPEATPAAETESKPAPPPEIKPPEKKQTLAAAADSTSMLSPIPKTSVQYDDQAKPSASNGPAVSREGTAKTRADASGELSAGGDGVAAALFGRRHVSRSETNDSDALGGTSPSESAPAAGEGDDRTALLLAQLLGKPSPPAGERGGEFPAIDQIVKPLSTDAPNIFQYASFIYRRTVHRGDIGTPAVAVAMREKQ